MADKRIIAIVGATGTQGGGLARAILDDPGGGFAVRAITRDTSKDKARALAASGADVLYGDLDDVRSLTNAFAGAHGVYALTNFWEHFSAEREKAQAKNIADAVRSANVKHIIWSTLEDTRKLMAPDDRRMPFLHEKYRVPHFDGKAEADAYFADLPVTFLLLSFYWDNMYTFGLGPKSDNGHYTWSLPLGNSRLSGIAADDIGKAAYGIYRAAQQYIGKTVGVAGEHLTLTAMADSLSKALGVLVEYQPADADAYRAAGGAELGNMFQVYRDFERQIVEARSVEQTRKLNPQLQNFEQWLAKHRDAVRTAAQPASA